MKPTEGHCERAFNEGRHAREAYPLPYGRYKLQESRRHLVQALETLRLILVTKNAGVSMKRQPELITRDLGYDIIPAVEALAGDGVSANEVRKLSRVARLRASDLVRRCDEARDRLHNSGVHLEYALAQRGESMLEPLLVDTISLIDEMLRASDKTRSAA